MYINNHTSIWGSYWDNGQWGYKCCHSFTKNSYCTGFVGIEAANSSNPLANSSSTNNLTSTNNEESSSTKKTLVELHNENTKKSKSKNTDDVNKHLKRKDLGEGDVKLDSKKLKKALEYEEKRHKLKYNEVEEDDRKRPYNSAYMGKSGSTEAEVTEEDLEAYRLKKQSSVLNLNYLYFVLFFFF